MIVRASSSSSSSQEERRQRRDEPEHLEAERGAAAAADEEGVKGIDDVATRYDKISRRRKNHLKKYRVDTFDLVPKTNAIPKKQKNNGSGGGGRRKNRKGLEDERSIKTLSNRAVFRQTPVDAKVFERIRTLRLCEEHRRAQRLARGQIKEFRKKVSPTHKVPVQMRFYPYYGDLDPQLTKFLGIAKRDKLRLITTCSTVEQVEEATEVLPSDMEFAFAGRSNVGKSSLINALSLATCAKSANTPGYTQSLHFYGLKNHLNLVDMPGYGYASAGYDQVDAWNELMDSYLLSRGNKRLRRVYVVIDARHGIKQNDREFIHMLSRNKVKFQLVMNKTDACKDAELAKRWWHVNEEIRRLPNAVHRIHMCSSRTGAGVQELTKEIFHLTSHIRGTATTTSTSSLKPNSK